MVLWCSPPALLHPPPCRSSSFPRIPPSSPFLAFLLLACIPPPCSHSSLFAFLLLVPYRAGLRVGHRRTASYSADHLVAINMHLTTSLQTFLLALTLLALGLLPLALLAQSDLTPPLLDQSGGDPSTLSSTLAIWSEHLFSLLGPGGPEPPQGQGRLRTFLDDLHLAFVPRRHASHKRKRSHFDSEQLSLQEVTKCKAQLRGLSARHGGLGTRPLPTQSVSGGYGEGGRETIAVIQPCGGIPVGASSKEFHITCNTIANELAPAVDVQTTTGPNGQATWFTCGISLYEKDSGWIPPNATIEQIITLEGGLRAAVKMDGSPYTACNDYIEIFEAAGGEFGSKHIALAFITSSSLTLCKVPPLFIAAFALQESSCNPTTIGQGGRTGMMHISAVRLILSCLRCRRSPITNRTSVPTRLTVIAWM